MSKVTFDDDQEEAPMPMVYVRWTDAISNTHGWMQLEDAIDWAAGVEWLVETVGWVLKETKEFLLIGAQRGEFIPGEGYQYGLLQKIPKTWIKLRVDLTEHI